MNILIIIGTRPEAIKMAPLVCHLRRSAGFQVRLCLTGQHREMLYPVLRFFGIQPDYDLQLMLPGQNLNNLAGRMFAALDPVLAELMPDMVLVHGDTTTSWVAAMSAFHRGIAVGHVEAGLRTYNRQAPYPEEINRQLTGRIADWHFAPTGKAADNLRREGVAEDRIIVTGNTVIDALHTALAILDTNDTWVDEEVKRVVVSLNGRRFILVTGHRRENLGQGFEELCDALIELANRYDTAIIYPVHLNPAVRQTVFSRLESHPRIHLLPPVDYPSFVWLMQQCCFIITDSGGIQEEAPSLGKPVLVCRQTTERPEAVTAGTVVLVGTDPGQIIDQAGRLLTDGDWYQMFSRRHNPYGDGTACQRIADCLSQFST